MYAQTPESVQCPMARAPYKTYWYKLASPPGGGGFVVVTPTVLQGYMDLLGI